MRSQDGGPIQQTFPAGFRTGLILSISLLLSILAIGCGKAADDPDRSSEPPPVNPAGAAHLIEAQDALRGFDFSRALALIDSAETYARASDTEFLADASFLRARVLSQLNRDDEALDAYERVLALENDYKGVWLNLGNAAFRQKAYSRAVSYFRREHELHPDPALLVHMGRAYAELGHADSARITYEEALEFDEHLSEAHIRLGQLYEESGQVESALSHARRALELDGTDAGYRYLVGLLLLQSERPRDALSHLETVAASRPDDHEVHYNLAQALARLGRRDEATSHLLAADSLREIDRELNEWETLTTLHPEDPAIWATYGFALARGGRSSQAMHAFSVALHLDPGNVDVRLLLANLYLETGSLGRAAAHYQVTLTEDPDRIDAWINAGIAYARAGHDDAARQAWETALELDPSHAEAAAYLNGLRETAE